MFGRLDSFCQLRGSGYRLSSAVLRELSELQNRDALPSRFWHRAWTDLESKNGQKTIEKTVAN